MSEVKRYNLIHNGYNISFHETEEQARQKMEEILSEHKDLSPKLVTQVDTAFVRRDTEQGLKSSIWVYQYYTLYTEVFQIVEGWF